MADFAAGRGEEGPRCRVEQCFSPPPNGAAPDENAAICSVAFDQTGAWLGVGDRGGAWMLRGRAQRAAAPAYSASQRGPKAALQGPCGPGCRWPALPLADTRR